MSQTKCYQAYGLNFRSEVKLPYFKPGGTGEDVSICLGKTPAEIKGQSSKGILWQASPGHFLLKAPEGTKFFVHKGQEVVIEPASDSYFPFLHGSVMGALLQQRGLLTLHGSGFLVEDKAILILGPSGGGKSTLLAGLHKLGHTVICENIAAIQNGKVRPESPIFKLWPQAAVALDYSLEEGEFVREGFPKRLYRTENFATQSYTVGGILLLQVNSEEISIEPCEGSMRSSLLLRNCYRRGFSKGFRALDTQFHELEKLLRVPVSLIRRPAGLEFIEELPRKVIDFLDS